MSNNKQSSSVELFIDQLEEKSWENASMNRIEICMNVEEYLALKEQAKAMHKEEVKTAHVEGFKTPSDYFNAEYYYEVTFNTKEK